MIIGLDLDNTIVCYDRAIEALAEGFLRIPKSLPKTKTHIRDYLRDAGRESDWTRFQGELYGPGMIHAELFDHVIDVLNELENLGHEIRVISHRTRFPYLGERHDLHQFACTWISARIPKISAQVTFHEAKAEKVNAIAEAACDFFLDDLPQILTDSRFPASTIGILFSPQGENSEWSGKKISSWQELTKLVTSCGRR